MADFENTSMTINRSGDFHKLSKIRSGKVVEQITLEKMYILEMFEWAYMQVFGKKPDGKPVHYVPDDSFAFIAYEFNERKVNSFSLNNYDLADYMALVHFINTSNEIANGYHKPYSMGKIAKVLRTSQEKTAEFLTRMTEMEYLTYNSETNIYSFPKSIVRYGKLPAKDEKNIKYCKFYYNTYKRFYDLTTRKSRCLLATIFKVIPVMNVYTNALCDKTLEKEIGGCIPLNMSDFGIVTGYGKTGVSSLKDSLLNSTQNPHLKDLFHFVKLYGGSGDLVIFPNPFLLYKGSTKQTCPDFESAMNYGKFERPKFLEGDELVDENVEITFHDPTENVEENMEHNVPVKAAETVGAKRKEPTFKY